MTYSKPEVTNVARTTEVVRSGGSKGNFSYPDNNGSSLPKQSQPAYEADE